jgi:hypothetical protein
LHNRARSATLQRAREGFFQGLEGIAMVRRAACAASVVVAVGLGGNRKAIRDGSLIAVANAQQGAQYDNTQPYQGALKCTSDSLRAAVVKYMAGAKAPTNVTPAPVLTTPSNTWRFGSSFTTTMDAGTLGKAVIALPTTQKGDIKVTFERTAGVGGFDVKFCLYYRSNRTKSWAEVTMDTLMLQDETEFRYPKDLTGPEWLTLWTSKGMRVSNVDDSRVVVAYLDPALTREKTTVKVTAEIRK